MPFTINGVGTSYHGHRNPTARHGQCSSCGHVGMLGSYDTTEVFVILFIPVIPLGKKHIIDQCSRCKRHRVTSAHQWDAVKNNVRTAVEEFRAKPDDAQAAKQAIGGALALQDREALAASADIAAEHLLGDSELQAALGHGFMIFRDYPRAEEAFMASLAVKDDIPTRESLAAAVAHQRRPEDALPWAEHLLENPTAANMGLPYLIVEAYQAQGQHAEAIDLLNRLGSRLPALQKSKDFKKYLAASSKNLHSQRPVTRHWFKQDKPMSGVSESRWGKRLPWLIMPAVILLVLGAYLTTSIVMGQNRTVHLVNGTNSPYQVTINGTSYTLRAQTREPVSLGEGDFTMQVSGTPVPVPDQTFSISTSFWLRPFRPQVIVVNPDRTAMLMRETVEYSSSNRSIPNFGSTGSMEANQGYIGKVVYQFSNIDYPFEPFPSTVTTSSKYSSSVVKRRLSIDDKLSAGQIYEYIVSEQGDAAARDYLLSSAQFGSNDFELWGILGVMVPVDEQIAFLKPGVDHRPFLVEWHRAYQEAMEKKDPAFDLKGQYQSSLAEAPTDGARIYLAARLERDVTKREMEYLRAVDAGLKSSVVWYYLTYDYLSTGRFDKAAEAARKLTALNPTSLFFHQMHIDSLMALERWEEALRENMRMVFIDPDNPFIVNERMILMMKSGEPERGEEYAEQFTNRVRRDNGVPYANTWARFFKAQREYVRGDASAFAAELQRDPPMQGWQDEALVTQGKLAEAAEEIAKTPERSLDDHLVLTLAAMLKGDDAFAHEHLKAAIEQLRKDSPSDNDLVAAWLESESAPNANDVCLTPMALRTKIVVLTILGLKHPSIREPCFNLAKRLDFDPQYPHLLTTSARESAK